MEGIIIREGIKDDIYFGLLECLKSAWYIGESTYGQYLESFKKRKKQKVITFVAIDTSKTKKFCVKEGSLVIGTCSLILEQKLIHNCGYAAHLEDVVVLPKYKGKGIGEALVKYAIEEARKANAYKIILDCDKSLVPFYNKNGFKKHSVCMRLDLQ